MEQPVAYVCMFFITTNLRGLLAIVSTSAIGYASRLVSENRNDPLCVERHVKLHS